jgi:predicted nucleic acid-binding protein
MTVFLPDTSVLIDTLRHKPHRVDLVRTLLMKGHSLACCAVTVSEMYAGMRPAESAITAQLLSTLIWVETSFPVARKAGELRYAWARNGVTLTLSDTMIAATAMHYGMTLITDNAKDFPMPELTIYSFPE